MIVQAYCGFKRGGSGVRTVCTEEEAKKILTGGYGVTTVRLETPNGGIAGMRWKDGRRWLWFYDPMYFQ